MPDTNRNDILGYPAAALAFGALCGALTTAAGCIVGPLIDPRFRGWYALAAWVAVTGFWTFSFRNARTKVTYVAGSVAGLAAAAVVMYWYARSFLPFPDGWW
jgi:hypothetical protein